MISPISHGFPWYWSWNDSWPNSLVYVICNCKLNHIFCMMGSFVYSARVKRTAMCIILAICCWENKFCSFSASWKLSYYESKSHGACNVKQLFDLMNSFMLHGFRKKNILLVFIPTSVWQMLQTATRSAVETSKMLRKGIFTLESSGMESTHNGIFSTDDVKEKAVQK